MNSTSALIAFLLLAPLTAPVYSHEVIRVDPNWHASTTEVKTALTIQVCAEPPLLGDTTVKQHLFDTLRSFRADYARLQFWFPYPRLGVAELDPPTDGKTYWDFSLMDSVVESFFEASEGRPVMLNFSTTPQWMYNAPQRVSYPANPYAIAWGYNQGTVLRDHSIHELRDYYQRVAEWYVDGGFTDEAGIYHPSGHHHKIDYWEVLNEIESEHALSPEMYTKIYDEIVEGVRRVSPNTKFSGLVLSVPSDGVRYFEYFLDQSHHREGIPLDMVSLHFYAFPELDEPLEAQQFTFFGQVDGLVSTVRNLQEIRRRLSPATRVYINEAGSLTAHPAATNEKISPAYWHLSAAMFAYMYVELAKLQIDLVAGAELINYPGQYAGTSLSDWNTGFPNARFQVLRILHDHISPGDKLLAYEPNGGTSVQTSVTPSMPDTSYAIQPIIGSNGVRKLFVINKRNRPVELRIVGANGAKMDYVDVSTGASIMTGVQLHAETVMLKGYAVAAITLADR
jgi:hypothetical protein